jgi:hypothetical protein
VGSEEAVSEEVVSEEAVSVAVVLAGVVSEPEASEAAGFVPAASGGRVLDVASTGVVDDVFTLALAARGFTAA